MERAERETIILLNRGEMDDGYFTFSTSEKSDFERLCRRIGGREKLIEVNESKFRNKGGVLRVEWWECKVPVRFLSKATWSIGARKSRKLNEAQREAVRERLQKGREAQLRTVPE